jgi:CRISPR/Cas system CSM-associated protein Csm2 small subunit
VGQINQIRKDKAMADIRKLYFDLIDSIYPYAECYEDIDRNMTESEMLYNLIEMNKDMLKDEDTKEDRNKINTLIELFQALGIKPTI